MDPWFIFFAIIGVGATAGVAALAMCLAPTVAKHFLGAPAGWGELASVYSATAPAPPKAWHRQSLVVGRILYRRCVAVAPTKAGLYLKLGFPASILGRPALLIPWSSFKRLDGVRLFWREAAMLSLGNPTKGTLTLPMDLFEKIREHLPTELVDNLHD